MGFSHRFLTLLCPSGGFRGAYDPFASSIVHAYEPARRVLSSYTGNRLVRLRRASDNAEADFGYLANGDLNVAAIAAWAGGASYVVTVYDQGPFGDNVPMAVAANQPLYVANARNGHAGMLFDGTNDYLQGAFATGGALSQPISTFAVAQLDATDVNNNVSNKITDSDDALNRLLLGAYGVGTPDSWYLYAGVFLSGGTADSNWNIWSVLYNGAASQFWCNQTSVVSGNAGADNADGLTIGADKAGLVPWKGYITSVIIVDPSLSNAQRTAMETAMNAYWSCY